jgi:hypothetical protein
MSARTQHQQRNQFQRRKLMHSYNSPGRMSKEKRTQHVLFRSVIDFVNEAGKAMSKRLTLRRTQGK